MSNFVFSRRQLEGVTPRVDRWAFRVAEVVDGDSLDTNIALERFCCGTTTSPDVSDAPTQARLRRFFSLVGKWHSSTGTNCRVESGDGVAGGAGEAKDTDCREAGVADSDTSWFAASAMEGFTEPRRTPCKAAVGRSSLVRKNETSARREATTFP